MSQHVLTRVIDWRITMVNYEFNGVPIYFPVEIYHDIVPLLGGITEKQFFLNAGLCIAAWQAEIDFIREEFGELLEPRKPAAAPNSYGHLICLGCPVRYPDDAEPNISPAVTSIDDAITALEESREMDFTTQPIFVQYAELSRKIHEAFPNDAPIFSGLGLQGPLTSAALFRGQDFYLDIMDEPEKCAQYLHLMTDSIIDFRKQCNLFKGEPAINPNGIGLADDLASMIPPKLWDELVLPFWRQYYLGSARGKDWSLHCEALTPAHLPYLEKAGVIHYQPSVSPALTIDTVRQNTGIPFDWLLYSYHITDMTDAEIEVWIDNTVHAGITSIRTQFGKNAVVKNKLDRIHAWFHAADKYRV
ncbi:MAG TPA: hypothetical protein DIW17_02040 [Clostridiales bacterium]|nr:hypothetical protein [Clostridiales bacterium]